MQLRRARQDTVEPQTLSRDDPEHHAPVLPPRGRAERQPGRRRVTAATSPARFPPQPIPLGPSPSLSVLPVTTHSGCDRPRTCIRSAGKGKGGGGDRWSTTPRPSMPIEPCRARPRTCNATKPAATKNDVALAPRTACASMVNRLCVLGCSLRSDASKASSLDSCCDPNSRGLCATRFCKPFHQRCSPCHHGQALFTPRIHHNVLR